MRLAPLVLACFLLNSCGTAPHADASEHKDSAKASDLPRAGLYQVTTTSQLTGDAPGVPGTPETMQTCYPAVSEETLLETEGVNCTRESVRIENGSINATLRCTAPGTAVQDVPLDIQGSYDSDSAETTGDLVMPQGMIRKTKKLERIGDC